jgi:hypothetical protein
MTDLRPWLWDWWRPFRLHVLFILLTAVVIPLLTRHHPDKAQRGEWYPFSNFPMYSDFEKQAYYVYLTDRDDRPMSVGETFGRAPSDVKKAYDNKLKAAARKTGKPSKKLTPDERRPVAEELLRELRETGKADQVRKLSGLRLWQVDITLEGERIVQRTSLVGELP